MRSLRKSPPPRNWIGRRTALQGLGLAASASPFIPVLNASGSEGPKPKRLVLFFTPHGTVHENWVPQGGETDFAFGSILAPLERHRGKVAVLDGINVRADTSVGFPHTKGLPLLWTASELIEDGTFTRVDANGAPRYYGWNSGVSVDQLVAERCGGSTPYRSLEFGVRTSDNHPGHRMVYRAPEQPLIPENNPQVLFDRLFGSGVPLGELERIAAERRSVLEMVRGELALVRGRVGRDDRFKIDAHLEAVRDIERTIGAAAECEGPVIGAVRNPLANANVPRVFDLQMQLLARAFACDLTRVASLQCAVGEVDNIVYDWVGVGRDRHHAISHENTPVARAELSSIYAWFSEQFARLLDYLNAIPEEDGTVLDHTLVVWGSEIGRGWDHSFDSVPFVLAGGADGAIPMGRFLQSGGAWHNRLLVSVCHAMGLNDIHTFGSTDENTGPLPGLV